MRKKLGLVPLRTIIVILAGIAVAACGGGGGSSSGGNSPAGYSGNTDAALIDAQTAEEIALAAYEAGELQSEMGFVPTLGAGMASLSLADTLSASLAAQDFSQAASVSAAMQSETMYGDCSDGPMTLTISAGAGGNFSGSMKYNNYCSAGVTVEGSMTFSGSYKEETGAMNFTMKFNALTMTIEGESFTNNGSISMVMNVMDPNAPLTYQTTMNTQAGTGEVCRLDGYKMTMTPGSVYDTVTVEGKYYYGDLGYVTISTDPDLQISYLDDYPQSGTIHIEGADETWATMTFTGGGGYQIDGSGLASPVAGNFNLSGTGGNTGGL